MTEIETTGTETTQNETVQETEAQKLRSWLGRVEKTSKEQQEGLKSGLQALTEKIESLASSMSKPNGQSKDLSALDEKLRDMILEGKVSEALNTHLSLRSEAENQLSALKERKLNEALNAINGDESPFTKGKENEIREEAKKLINKGTDPLLAVQHAAMAIERSVLRSIANEHLKENPSRFEMLGTGEPPKKTAREGKLPPEFQAAMEDGIKRGIFKDKADYVASMPPKLRAKIGV